MRACVPSSSSPLLPSPPSLLFSSLLFSSLLFSSPRGEEGDAADREGGDGQARRRAAQGTRHHVHNLTFTEKSASDPRHHSSFIHHRNNRTPPPILVHVRDATRLDATRLDSTRLDSIRPSVLRFFEVVVGPFCFVVASRPRHGVGTQLHARRSDRFVRPTVHSNPPFFVSSRFVVVVVVVVVFVLSSS